MAAPVVLSVGGRTARRAPGDSCSRLRTGPPGWRACCEVAFRAGHTTARRYQGTIRAASPMTSSAAAVCLRCGKQSSPSRDCVPVLALRSRSGGWRPSRSTRR
eukprot:2295533-Prymnesium_polylepis.1